MKPGDLVADRYRLEGVIKDGAFGAVYRAFDTRDQTPCAVKVSLGIHDAQWASRKFHDEAAVLGQLHHPDIPGVRDCFQVDDLTCIVMDYVEGVNLEQEMEAARPPEGRPRLPADRVVSDAIVVLGVLEYLHGFTPPLLHLDIKPANIVRSPTGRVKLVDFGLAREYTSITRTAAGTFAYCSMEQMRGKPTVRSDQYSLGATMYELLSGHAPLSFSPEPLRSMNPDLDPRLARIVDRAVAPEPERRFESATAMRRALVELSVRPGQRLPLLLGLILGASLVFGLAFLLARS